MKLSYFYDLVIKFGSKNDPRKDKFIKAYSDTAILFGSPSLQVKKVFVGIDIETPELLLAEGIRRQQGLDLVISHHPEGSAYAGLAAVMQLQVSVLSQLGIKESVAQKLLDERKLEVERKIMPQNHTRPIDAARLLNIPFMCIHTPADNHVFTFIKHLMAQMKPKKLKDVVDILMTITEYREAEKNLTGPRIILGSPLREAGKILVDMTGGTEGSKDVFEQLYKAGIRTLICMHLGEEHFKKALDAKLNAIIAGHISSDALGLNLLLDNIEKESKENLQVIGCSGFNRIRRI